MTQNRLLDFAAARRTRLLNDHYKNILPRGVYLGYNVQQTTSPSMVLHIKLNGATESTLLTLEGVKVTESADLLNAVTVTAADPTFPRIDIVVANHVYSNLNNPATYSVVAGTPSATPSAPTPSASQVKLADVYVGAAVTSISNANITNVSLVNVGNPFGSYIDLVDLGILRPHQNSPLDDSAHVDAGRYIKSDGSASVQFAGGSSPVFGPVITPGNSRIDLLTIDDSGTLVLDAGTEALSPTVPAYPTSRQVIAEVLIDEVASVIISDDDITDCRFFLNMGTAGVFTVAPQLSVQTASGGQTVFTVPTYTLGRNELLVFSSGVFMSLGSDYTETTTTSITFLSGRASGEPVTIWKVGPTVTPSVGTANRQAFTASAGQTLFTLTLFTYVVAAKQILVYQNGLLQALTADYAETSTSSLTLTVGAAAGDIIEVVLLPVV